MQDMFYSQSLRRFAFAKGVGAATPENPRVNFTGDPYWTDGLRLVMWLSEVPVSYQRVENERWQPAPQWRRRRSQAFRLLADDLILSSAA